MKNDITDLASFGGQQAFAQPLHVGAPNIGNREHLLERVNNLLDRRWLTNGGPFVREFEQKIAELIGVKHCIAMTNGTIALEIAIRALGLTGEVIVPSMTFIATAHALQWQEITPVFCDVEPKTYTLDPDCVERMITPRTTGIIGVHLWGRPCDVERLNEIAQHYRLKLVYDAAHAFGCTHNRTYIGSFGDAEVFSFHATKFLNSFEGGAVATNNDVLARKIRLMKNFGFAGYDNVIYPGTNGKMSEVAAAMGLTSLESMAEFVAANHRNYKQYQRELKDIPGIQVLSFDEAEACNYQYIVLEINQNITKISRDRLADILIAENILARRYFYPGCHRMEPYRSYQPHAGLLLPETERIVQQVLTLPTGTSIRPDDIARICQVIRFVIQHAKQLDQEWHYPPTSVIPVKIPLEAEQLMA